MMGLIFVKRWLVQRLTSDSLEPRSEEAPQVASSIVRLPSDILQQIVGYLSDSTVSAFALCSRQLLKTVGLRPVRPEPVGARIGEWTALLVLLERDLPDHILCTSCTKLHRTKYLAKLKEVLWYHGPRYCIWEPKCLKEDYKRKVTLYFYPRFSFDRVQMALKQARLGLNWRQHIDDVAYSEAELEDEIPARHRQVRNNWFLFQHRIVNDEMYIRAQQWFLVPLRKRHLISTARFGNVCGHVGSLAIHADHNLLRRALEYRFDHMFTGEPPCYSCQTDLISCKFCPTEACIDIKHLPDRIALVVTKWMRIGPGISRNDPTWSSRLRRAEPETLDDERATGEAVARNASAAAARELQNAAYGFGNGPFVYEEGSIMVTYGTGDTEVRSRLSLAPEHQKAMLEVVLPPAHLPNHPVPPAPAVIADVIDEFRTLVEQLTIQNALSGASRRVAVARNQCAEATRDPPEAPPQSASWLRLT